MSVLAAKLIRLVHGDFYCQKQNESKQKRPPWQEAVFSVANNLGRLSPQGGDLVQKIPETYPLGSYASGSDPDSYYLRFNLIWFILLTPAIYIVL